MLELVARVPEHLAGRVEHGEAAAAALVVAPRSFSTATNRKRWSGLAATESG
jgi:hypothetical protein